VVTSTFRPHFTRNDLVPIVQGGSVSLETGLDSTEKLAPAPEF
jgi:hypothetical protein